MPVDLVERAGHEPSLEVLIRAVNRLTLVSYMDILTEVRLSLLEIDRLVLPGRVPRIEWGIREVAGARDVRVVLAPAKHSSRRPPGTSGLPAVGLVDGLNELSEDAEIPPYFSATTVERVQKVGRRVERGDVAGVELTSVNGRRQEASVSQQVIQSARKAVQPATRSWGSVTGVLDTISARNAAQPRGEVSVRSGRGARGVVIRAGADQAGELREAWGKRVLAAGELTRNSAGQPVRVDLTELHVLHDDEHPLTPWDILGIAPDYTGGLTSQEYLDQMRDG